MYLKQNKRIRGDGRVNQEERTGKLSDDLGPVSFLQAESLYVALKLLCLLCGGYKVLVFSRVYTQDPIGPPFPSMESRRRNVPLALVYLRCREHWPVRWMVRERSDPGRISALKAQVGPQAAADAGAEDQTVLGRPVAQGGASASTSTQYTHSHQPSSVRSDHQHPLSAPFFLTMVCV